MLLESLIMLQESSIALLENVYSTGVTHDDCNMFIVQATDETFVSINYNQKKFNSLGR